MESDQYCRENSIESSHIFEAFATYMCFQFELNGHFVIAKLLCASFNVPLTLIMMYNKRETYMA